MQGEQHQQASSNFLDQSKLGGQQAGPKKKRSLPGMPDPAAEIVALSPRALLATNRFICEICNKGFQRDQNLQLHRRGHDLPWRLKQRTTTETRKRVYICPETSCVHHHPSRALGDLTGIKKHFSRKHGEKKWKCDKCSKKYAVQSDWKAHSKTCGTREYRCDCGILFSRRDSFITHRAFCDALAEESAKLYAAHNQSYFQPQNLLNYGTNIPSSGKFSPKCASPFLRPSETLLMAGGSDTMFESETGTVSYETAAPAVGARWREKLGSRSCQSEAQYNFDQRLPTGLGRGIEMASEGSPASSIDFKAQKEVLTSSFKMDRPSSALPNVYGAHYSRPEDCDTLSNNWRLEKLTRSAPSFYDLHDHSKAAPVSSTSSPRMDLSGIQKSTQEQSTQSNHRQEKIKYVEFIGSSYRAQPTKIVGAQFSSVDTSSSSMPPPFFGGWSANGNICSSFLRHPKFQLSRPQNSATALLQKAAQMGARASSSDHLLKAFEIEGMKSLSSSQKSALSPETSIQEIKVGEGGASCSNRILFGRMVLGETPPICNVMDNSLGLDEGKIAWSDQLYTASCSSGVLNLQKSATDVSTITPGLHLVPNSKTGAVFESERRFTDGKFEDESLSSSHGKNASEHNDTGYTFGPGGSHSTGGFEDSSAPFTRDFLGVDRASNGTTKSTAISVALSSCYQKVMASTIPGTESLQADPTPASFGSKYWSTSAGTD